MNNRKELFYPCCKTGAGNKSFLFAPITLSAGKSQNGGGCGSNTCVFLLKRFISLTNGYFGRYLSFTEFRFFPNCTSSVQMLKNRHR